MPKRLVNACTVPETTDQQAAAASRDAVAGRVRDRLRGRGRTPRSSGLPDFTVFSGPSVTVEPSRRTVIVIGLPWLARIRAETFSNVGVARPSTATTRSPGRSPAIAAGMPDSTWPTFVLAFCDGAPVA